MALFEWGSFPLHSGGTTKFFIDCDALSDKSIESLANYIAHRFKFNAVYGIPRGGIRLADALRPFCNPKARFPLIVDDVVTTGQSFRDVQTRFDWHEATCVAIFKRSVHVPKDIYCILEMPGGCP